MVVLLFDGLAVEPLEPYPDPELPMELVPPPVPAVLPEPIEPEPAVDPEPLPVEGLVEGLVVLEELVEPVPPVEPVVPPSGLLQALSESAATTATVAAAY